MMSTTSPNERDRSPALSPFKRSMTEGERRSDPSSLFDMDTVSYAEPETTLTMNRVRKRIVTMQKAVLRDASISLEEEHIIRYEEYSRNEQLKFNIIGSCSKEGKIMGSSPSMPSLRLELSQLDYQEPTRDRDKKWTVDSQRGIVNQVDKDNLFPTFPLKLGKYGPLNTPSSLFWSAGYQSMVRENIILRKPCIISETNCIVTVYGVGINGRVLSSGANDGKMIILESYSTWNNEKQHIVLNSAELKVILSGEKSDLLKPGKKMDLIGQLTKLLYYDYTMTIPAHPDLKWYKETVHRLHHLERPKKVPVGYPKTVEELTRVPPKTPDDPADPKPILTQELKICRSFQVLPNGPVLRAQILEAKRKEQEADELRRRLAFLSLPKRKRHLVAIKATRYYNKLFILRAYISPMRPTTVQINAQFHLECDILRHTIGFAKMKEMLNIEMVPAKWSDADIDKFARELLNHIKLVRINEKECLLQFDDCRGVEDDIRQTRSVGAMLAAMDILKRKQARLREISEGILLGTPPEALLSPTVHPYKKHANRFRQEYLGIGDKERDTKGEELPALVHAHAPAGCKMHHHSNHPVPEEELTASRRSAVEGDASDRIENTDDKTVRRSTSAIDTDDRNPKEKEILTFEQTSAQGDHTTGNDMQQIESCTKGNGEKENKQSSDKQYITEADNQNESVTGFVVVDDDDDAQEANRIIGAISKERSTRSLDDSTSRSSSSNRESISVLDDDKADSPTASELARQDFAAYEEANKEVTGSEISESAHVVNTVVLQSGRGEDTDVLDGVNDTDTERKSDLSTRSNINTVAATSSPDVVSSSVENDIAVDIAAVVPTSDFDDAAVETSTNNKSLGLDADPSSKDVHFDTLEPTTGHNSSSSSSSRTSKIISPSNGTDGDSNDSDGGSLSKKDGDAMNETTVLSVRDNLVAAVLTPDKSAKDAVAVTCSRNEDSRIRSDSVSAKGRTDTLLDVAHIPSAIETTDSASSPRGSLDADETAQSQCPEAVDNDSTTAAASGKYADNIHSSKTEVIVLSKQTNLDDYQENNQQRTDPTVDATSKTYPGQALEEMKGGEEVEIEGKEERKYEESIDENAEEKRPNWIRGWTSLGHNGTTRSINREWNGYCPPVRYIGRVVDSNCSITDHNVIEKVSTPRDLGTSTEGDRMGTAKEQDAPAAARPPPPRAAAKRLASGCKRVEQTLVIFELFVISGNNSKGPIPVWPEKPLPEDEEELNGDEVDEGRRDETGDYGDDKQHKEPNKLDRQESGLLEDQDSLEDSLNTADLENMDDDELARLEQEIEDETSVEKEEPKDYFDVCNDIFDSYATGLEVLLELYIPHESCIRGVAVPAQSKFSVIFDKEDLFNLVPNQELLKWVINATYAEFFATAAPEDVVKAEEGWSYIARFLLSKARWVSITERSFFAEKIKSENPIQSIDEDGTSVGGASISSGRDRDDSTEEAAKALSDATAVTAISLSDDGQNSSSHTADGPGPEMEFLEFPCDLRDSMTAHQKAICVQNRLEVRYSGYAPPLSPPPSALSAGPPEVKERRRIGVVLAWSNVVFSKAMRINSILLNPEEATAATASMSSSSRKNDGQPSVVMQVFYWQAQRHVGIVVVDRAGGDVFILAPESALHMDMIRTLRFMSNFERGSNIQTQLSIELLYVEYMDESTGKKRGRVKYADGTEMPGGGMADLDFLDDGTDYAADAEAALAAAAALTEERTNKANKHKNKKKVEEEEEEAAAKGMEETRKK